MIFIIISGYDLFEYARSALENGAFAYLLKPVKSQELGEVIEKARAKLALDTKNRKNNTLTRIKANQATKLLQQQFLLDLFSEDILSVEYINRKLKELGIYFLYDLYSVVIVSIDNDAIKDLDINDKNIYKFSIENIASEIFTEMDIITYPFPVEDGQGFVLNFADSNSFNSLDCEKNTLDTIRNYVKTSINITATFGMGQIVNNPEYLSRSYKSADKAVNMRLVKGNNQVFIYEDSNYKHTIRAIDYKAEQNLTLCFEKCDKAACLEIIEGIYSQFEKANIIDMEVINKINFHIILLIYKMMNQIHMNPEELFGNEFALYNKLNSCNSMNDIINWFDDKLEKCMERIMSSKQKGNALIIEKALEYIHANFNRDISLETVADYIHMSPSYFSKQLKLQVGEPFVDYLTGYRIKRAKEYLNEGIYKVNEVAKMVGFNDEKYFHKTFKKHTGLTPGKYH